VFDFESQAVEHAHVNVRDPYQGELGNDITPPSEAEHLKLRQKYEKGRHIVAEAIFAGKQIEEFT
jgi:hypothetical protein